MGSSTLSQRFYFKVNYIDDKLFEIGKKKKDFRAEGKIHTIIQH